MLRILALVSGLFVLLGALWAPAAHADEESITHFDVRYYVQADGSVDVQVEMDWHFDQVGRRGIIHDIVISEPWDDDFALDAQQRITDLYAYSPSGANDTFTVAEAHGPGHELVLRVTIGEEDAPLDTQDATYIIEYTVEGAMRTFDGEPELHVDAVSDGSTPIDLLTAQVTGPDDIQFARCLIGEHECRSEVDGGVAHYSVSGVDRALTLVAIFPPGSVTDAEPILVDSGRPSGDRGTTTLAATGTALAIFGSLFGISRLGRQKDDRYVDVAPTLTDPGGRVEQRERTEVPVQFHAPDLALHDAGVLLKRRYDADQLVATLTSLSVRGAVTLDSEPLAVRPSERPVPVSETEARLLVHAVDDDRLPMANARKMGGEMSAAANRTMNSSGLFKAKPRINGPVVAILGAAALWFIGSLAIYAFRHILGPFMVPLLIGLIAGCFLAGPVLLWGGGSRNTGRGLTADGTAALDQVEGFRTYIATAEAEQLSEQADRDIFTRNLPWAVLFGLTERWTRVCRQLAALGVIPPVDEAAVVRGGGGIDSGIESFRSKMSSASARPSSSGSGSSSGRSSSGGGSGSGGSRSRSW